jgi:hypothetical protein
MGPPNTTSRTIGALLLLPVAIRCILPLWRFFRVSPVRFLPVAYAIAISVVILVEFGFAAPIPLGNPQHPWGQLKGDDVSFYTGKNVSDFGIWDWLAAAGGGLIYVAAIIIWRNLLKPSPPQPSLPARENL